MPDFSKLMQRPAGQAKKPPALPANDAYPGVVKSFEVGDANKNKTPYVRFNIILTGWPAGVAEAWKDEDGKEVKREAIDVTKRQMRRDFYLTEDALWRLDEFLKSVGISMADDGSTTYEEVLPQAVGAPVVAQVQQYINKDNNEVGNQIGRLAGA